MDISNGCIVTATAGRDSGKLFLAVNIKDGYAEIIDGKGRRVEKPKKKKIKHLKPVFSSDTVYASNLKLGEKLKKCLQDIDTVKNITNSEIRKLIFNLRSDLSDAKDIED